jgi:6-phosphofructokinase 1
MILEVMGRHTGWIALAAGVAGGADVILLPELPYRIDVIADKIRQRNQSGAQFSLVVVAEGSHRQGDRTLFRPARHCGSGARPSGRGDVVATQLRQVCHADIRVTVLGHLQRGGVPTAGDRLLATRFGAQAVHLVAQGQVGHMVALQGGQIRAIPLGDVGAQPKRVSLGSDLVRAAFGLDICVGDRRQAIVGLPGHAWEGP